MPGSARRVRAAYSRTLCLPCLKAGIFCFLHYRYHCLYVQLFIFNFLCICLLLFGTSFFSRSSFKSVLPVALYRCCPNLHRGLARLQQGLSGPLLVSFPYPVPKTAHRAAQGRVWVFSPKTNSPLPLKGEGRGIAFLGFVGIALLVHNWLTRLQQGLFGAALVSLPTWLSKSHTGPHRGGFGFGLLAGDSEEDCL